MLTITSVISSIYFILIVNGMSVWHYVNVYVNVRLESLEIVWMYSDVNKL